jgi:hypothetical protein
LRTPASFGLFGRRTRRGQDRLDQPGPVFGQVADEVGRLGGKVWDEYVKSEWRLLAGDELPHAFPSRFGEVVPVSFREARLGEQLGEPLGRDEVALLR